MGEVYRARDGRLGREVALKILPEAFASDAERLARFDREARTLACLNHPHVAHVYGIEESGTTRALVMELVDGETLAERIARAPIALDEALAIARQVGEALDAVHESGVLHRDLKPANIKLRRDGVVKVLDFGLAKLLAEKVPPGDETPTRPESETRPGTVLGTTAYMSPEQARGQPLDRRTDIWSFGCVLYEMLARRRAFAGETRSDTIASVLARDPDWSALPVATPLHVRRLLRRCLEKDVRHRLRDIGDAVQELVSDHDPARLSHPEPLRARGLRAYVASAATFAMIGAGITAIWLWPRSDGFHSSTLTAVPLTTYPGFESAPTFSPDSSQIAFSWNGEREDNFDVYVKLVGAGAPLRLTSDPATDASPAWSPDGRWIAFLRITTSVPPGSGLPSGGATVMLIPALGGPERPLGRIGNVPFIGAPDFGNGLSWSADGAWLIVPDKPSAEAGGLFSWSVASGERRRLTTLPPKAWVDVGPALSPDGHSLAFTRFVGFGISDVYVLPVDMALRPAGEPKRLTHLNRFTSSPAWMPRGREIVFSAGSLTAGSQSLFAVGFGSGAEGGPRRLGSIGERSALVSISRPMNGRARMVYAQPHFDPGIWQIELPQARGAPAVGAAVPFLLSTRPEYQPQYSPDGQRVAFVSTRSGEEEIWTCDRSGANLAQLTSTAWPETAAPRWSPDGSRIAFHARPEGPGDIFTIAGSGGTPKRVTDDPADDWGASWSRDGEWIFFTSNRSGHAEIWKAASGGGTAVQVSRNGGMGPTLSPDGRHVYYVKGGELWRIAVDGDDASRVLESVGDWSRVVVTSDGVFFTPPRTALLEERSKYTIDFFSFRDEPIQSVVRLEKPPYLGMTISPDGRRLLYTQIDAFGMDLMLVEDVR